MSAFFYYLTVLLESGLSVVGVRAPYAQPAFRVIAHLPQGVEIRAYPERAAVAADIRDGNEGEAFGRLFRYITGANHAGSTMRMSAPVEQEHRSDGQKSGQKIAMTIPVEMTGDNVMRFFLPDQVRRAGPPAPTDPAGHLVTLPPADIAAIRFSGTLTEESRVMHADMLAKLLAGSNWRPLGPPSVLSYDPPFAIPFLRRNEIAVQVTRPPA
jgi:hypothetical protein